MKEVWLRGRLVGHMEGGAFYPLHPLTPEEAAEAEAIAFGKIETEEGETSGDADLPA